MIPWDRTKGRPEPIAALNRIPEVECGEPLVDIGDIAPRVRMLRPHVIPFVRLRVAEMCKVASEGLPNGYLLGLVEGWRPLARQQRIFDWAMECARQAFPSRTNASLRRTVCRWVAPTDQKAPPGHCTGGAVDVHLLDPDGVPLDVNSPFERHQVARTYSLGLSPQAHSNRMMLVDAMLCAGFSNCRDEWWHYSFGDAGWAVRLGFDSCFYGAVDLDPGRWAHLEDAQAESLAKRPNPFL